MPDWISLTVHDYEQSFPLLLKREGEFKPFAILHTSTNAIIFVYGLLRFDAP